ncbi:hypothetical protein [Brachyspira hampsonii]|uniref:Uncharacterized protein n=1 Tax=Brachyspira hampsonii TaxID=1287055 RepID=A0AAC9TUN2_9SPIR|nr:hypothetical protein [Brachyspira hampsonii]ASJ21092.1 hypothetical protein BHAMNSH16_05290 [Brachyspira hampsonii]ELV06504.1 hypothetical protein H263_03738 [Brachyspira hampsonii 30599]OEJ16821.1 hypothetical protein A9496_00650 [Brachyspira hampsonii]
MYNQDNNNYGQNNNYKGRNHKNRKNNAKYNNVFVNKDTKIKKFDIDSNLSNGIIKDSTIHKDISGNMADSIGLGRSVKYQDHRNNLSKAMNNYPEALKKVSDSKINMDPKKRIGFIDEVKLTESYNVNAAEQCREYKTEARLTKPGDPEADIIVRDGNTETKYQVKDNENAKVNTEEISKKRYSGEDGSNKKIVPEENVDEVRAIASKKQNTDTKDYKHTAENTYDRLSSKDGKVNSEKLNRNESEELTRRLENGERIEVKNKDAKFKAQYLNQLPKAALCGALFSGGSAFVGEFVKFLSNGCNLTEDEFIESAYKVLTATTDGAAKSALGVTFTYLGNRVGSSLLGKANIAGGMAVMTIDTLKSMYRFITGKIDTVELMGEVSQNFVSITSTSLGAYAGSLGGSALAGVIASNMSMGAAAAASLGAFASIAGSVVGGLAVGITVSYLISKDSEAGLEIARRDIEAAYQTFAKDRNLYALVEGVGTQRDWEFSFKSLIPFGGVFAQISEYSARKSELNRISSMLDREYENIDEGKRRVLADMQQKYYEAKANIEETFYSSINTMFDDDRIDLSNQLMDYLNQKRTIYALREKKYFNEIHKIDEKNSKLASDIQKDELFFKEVENLTNMLKDSDIENREMIIDAIAYLVSDEWLKNFKSDDDELYNLLLEYGLLD